MRSLALVAAVLALCACDKPKVPGRPVPTPGPQIVTKELSSITGGSIVARGERVRFAVVGTGEGTHFDETTFLHSPAFTDLRVVAVESSAKLWAQGTVSLAAGEGNKDLAAVTGDELAVEPWAFRVIPTEVADLGKVPCEGEGALEAPRAFDVFAVAPPTDAIKTLLVRLEPLDGAPASFAPSLELYSGDGQLLAASDHRCASVKVRSRAPVFVRVSDRAGAGGEAYRYRVAAAFGLPDACLAADPGGLSP